MSIRTTISALALALAALLAVALAPSDAAAHGGAPHAHVHAAKPAAEIAVVTDAAVAVTAELRAPAPLSPDDGSATGCSDRGCCSAGHCSGCGTALAPGCFVCLALSSATHLPKSERVAADRPGARRAATASQIPRLNVVSPRR